MRVVIVYESLFGNTRQVAEAIAEGIRDAEPHAQVSCVRATEANREVALDADLLAVGGPTHTCGLSSGFSRKTGLKADQVAAAREAGHPLEPGDAGPGVRDWFMALPKAAAGRLGAAFDTHPDSVVVNRAADDIACRLRHHGYELVTEPESFIIDYTHGPLHDGERDRARAWGARLVRQPVS
jgi:Flavodoxin